MIIGWLESLSFTIGWLVSIGRFLDHDVSHYLTYHSLSNEEWVSLIRLRWEYITDVSIEFLQWYFQYRVKYGTWDIYLGCGIFFDQQKHNAINHPFWGWNHSHCDGHVAVYHDLLVYVAVKSWLNKKIITWTYLGSDIDEPPLSLSIYIRIDSMYIYIPVCTCICTMTQRCGNGWHLKTKFNIINGGLRHGVLLHRIQSISVIVCICTYKLHGLCILYTSWHHTTAWH